MQHLRGFLDYRFATLWFILLIPGCVSLDDLSVAIPGSDGSAPEMIFETNPGARTTDVGEYEFFLFNNVYGIFNLAGDPESGVKMASIEYTLDVSCSAEVGGPTVFTRSIASEPETWEQSPDTDGRVNKIGAVYDYICLGETDSDKCAGPSIREEICGLGQIHSFRGSVTLQATNFREGTATKTYTVFASPGGRLGENCIEGVQTGDFCEDGNECRENVCSLPCVEGHRCTADGAAGACGARGVGRISCGVGTEPARCIAPIPAEEVCDGRDNNCNGETDEGIATTTRRVTPTDCQDTFTVIQTTQCQDGREVETTEEYCPFGGASDCGSPAFTACVAPFQTRCAPGLACQRTSNLDISESCQVNRNCPRPPPRCWRETDVGSVCL